jgi:2,4-dienoyl-CoA reductase (NADPH2)
VTAATPINVGGRQVANRLVMTPHLGRLSSTRFLDYLRARLPGPGIVITPAGAPVYAASPYPDAVGELPEAYRGDPDAVLPRAGGARSDEARAAWEGSGATIGMQAELVHGAGALLVGQIHHPGAERSWDSFQPSSAPSALDGEWPVQHPHTLTDGEADELIAGYAGAAGWIVEAGADGVEVHAAHGYLLNRFLSPFYNRREGRFGGDADGRWAMLRTILERVRDAIGPGALLGTRVPAWEQFDGGLTVDDVAAGVAGCAPWLDYVNVSIGNHDGLAGGRPVLAYTTPWLVPRPSLAEAGRRIGAASGLPVLVTGAITSAADVDAVLAGGADLVGIARATIADADFARKVLAGRGDAVNACIGCNECTLVPFSCTVNPAAGREAELAIRPATTTRAIAVVGGGPAGLVAGLAAAARGHHVTVYERGDALGGRLADLVRDPARARWATWLDRLRTEAGAALDVKLGVDVRALDDVDADVVVLAVGAVPAAADFDDDGTVPVRTSTEVLRGARPSGPVLVVGDTEPHLDPLLTARLLAAEGTEVHLVSQLVGVAPAVEQRTLNHLLRTLAEHGVPIATSTRLVALRAGVAHIEHLLSGVRRELQVGAVVRAGSRVSEPSVGSWRADHQARLLYVVGDALAPRRLTHAALEGARFGASV